MSSRVHFIDCGSAVPSNVSPIVMLEIAPGLIRRIKRPDSQTQTESHD